MPQSKKPQLQVIHNPGEPERSAPRGDLRSAPLPAEADDFDRLMDGDARRVSAIHWTPTQVCHRAAQLLAAGPGERVLDVGSGVGKLCVLGALISQGQYVGIEQRPGLVAQARRLAAHVSSPAQFLEGDAFDVDWSGFQALYFYNPFDEARFPVSWQIDGSIPLGIDVFNQLVQRAQDRLRGLPIGTRVVTFHGIGGPMPEGYQLVVSERIADGTLELWRRADSERQSCTPQSDQC